MPRNLSEEVRKLLRVLWDGQHNYGNRLPSDKFCEKLEERGVANPASLIQEARTLGYIGSEPSTTRFTLSGRDFHWIWITPEGVAYVSQVIERLHVENIDNFSRVRDVVPQVVAPLLKNGYLDVAEETVQIGLEAILGVSFHKADWAGEINDLYTANVIVDGKRRPTAFMLKGKGLKSDTMRIGDCGKNGDQVVRLFKSPADLFVIQFVGNISEAVIEHAYSENARRRTQEPKSQFLIIDGQDTARLLYAYALVDH